MESGAMRALGPIDGKRGDGGHVVRPRKGMEQAKEESGEEDEHANPAGRETIFGKIA